MKKQILVLSIFATTILGSSSMASAIMMPPQPGVKAPPMSTEDDGYRPDSDPLPEWLLLPDGVNENSLTFQGTEKTSLKVSEPGSTRWEIISTKNGSKLVYSHFQDNKLEFEIKTNNSYTKMNAYVMIEGKLKQTQTIDIDSYFDGTGQIVMAEQHRGFSLYQHAYAKTVDSPNTPIDKVNTHRISAKLTKNQLNKLNHKVGFRGKDAQIANRVAWWESRHAQVTIVACENGTAVGFNPKQYGVKGVRECRSRGATGAGRGLYQISSDYHPKCSNKCAFSASKNAKYAYKLRKAYGWTQWCGYGGCGPNDPNPAGQGPAMTSRNDW